jgi:hypothetical protein
MRGCRLLHRAIAILRHRMPMSIVVVGHGVHSSQSIVIRDAPALMQSTASAAIYQAMP